MATLCFLQVGPALALLCLARLLLAAAAAAWVLLARPAAPLPGPLGPLLVSALPGATALTVTLPALATETLSDLLFLLAVCRHCRTLLVPWIVLNTIAIITLLAAVLYHLVPVFLPALEDFEPLENEIEAALAEIHRFLNIIVFNLVLVVQIVSVSAALKLFIDLGYKRRVSFSKRTEKSEVAVTAATLYQERSDRLGSFSDGKEPPATIQEEEEEEEAPRRDSWEERETVMFRFDDEEAFA